MMVFKCCCLFLFLLANAAYADDPKPAGKTPLQVEHQLLADLGGEHIAQAIYRRGRAGISIVSWGDRILEWPLKKPQLREVVPPIKNVGYSNGGCALDIDGDGIDEIVVARGRGRWSGDPELYWFEEKKSGKWAAHKAGPMGRGSISPHDLVPISFSIGQRSVRGVLAVLDRRQLVWYEIPANPAEAWTPHVIATLPKKNQSGLKVGDVSGRGRADVLCGTYCVECPADPLKESWKVRRYSHWEGGGWGGMDKIELADLDGDGHPEIVASEAEIPESKLGIFSRDPQNPEGLWKYHEIDAGLYCPHSLVVTDIDGDKRADIVVGEMTAGGWSFPLNPHPRLIAYLNRGNGKFKRTVLDDNWGVHEMGLLPRKADGPVILFAADETQTQKFPEMKTYVNMWTIRLQK